jgi:SAM-dependent methyltransferase
MQTPVLDASMEVWPPEGLETLSACPVCEAKHALATAHFSDLRDVLFGCAPGAWRTWRCASCASLYVNPRPTAQTIGLAYRTYFTHGDDAGGTLGWRQSALGRAMQRYLRHRYGHGEPSGAAPWLPFPLKSLADDEMRHLPILAKAERAVLDVGCGAGEFLQLAQQFGWRSFGVDPDAQAVARAAVNGVQAVTGDIGTARAFDRQFDAITFRHTIEHMHAPHATLQTAHALLQSGGQLWLQVPNANAWGARLRGAHWRDLDPPRHLFVPTRAALARVVEQAGFVQLKWHRRPLVAPAGFLAARRIAVQRGATAPSRFRCLAEAAFAETWSLFAPDRAEWVTLVAHKS